MMLTVLSADTAATTPAADAAMMGFLLTLILVLAIPTLIFMFTLAWRFYARGNCPGWACFIPFYNTYCLFKIAYGNGWMMFLLLVPVVNLLLSLITPFVIARCYGKGFWFGLGYLFFPVYFEAAIAFGDLCYCGPNM